MIMMPWTADLGHRRSSQGTQTSGIPQALAAGAGVVMATGTPASRAMPPALVPAELLPNAMALRSIAGQSAMVAGPALGGVLYGVSPAAVYLLAAAMCLLASAAVVMITARPAAQPGRSELQSAPGLGSVLEGLLRRLVRRARATVGREWGRRCGRPHFDSQSLCR